MSDSVTNSHRQPTRLGLSRSINVIFIIAFFAALLYPTINGQLNLSPDIVSRENRVLATSPSLALPAKPTEPLRTLATKINQYPHQYDLFYNDNFTLRNKSIQLVNYAKLKLFNVSPNDTVIRGQDDWYYYAYGSLKEFHAGTKPFTQAELEQWRIALEQRHTWLAQQGIPYVFMLAPNKSTAYPEFLPQSFPARGATTRTDQLINYLREKQSSVQVIDVRDDIAREKSNRRLYWKTDSHWNEEGGFIGYTRLMSQISQKLPTLNSLQPNPRSTYTTTYTQDRIGDLALLMSVYEYVLEPDNPNIKLPAGRQYQQIEAELTRFDTRENNQVEYFRTQHKNQNLPRTVVFRDSFFWNVLPFFAEHFSDATYLTLPTGFDVDMVRARKPQIVVQQMVETTLGDYPPSNPAEVAAIEIK